MTMTLKLSLQQCLADTRSSARNVLN